MAPREAVDSGESESDEDSADEAVGSGESESGEDEPASEADGPEGVAGAAAAAAAGAGSGELRLIERRGAY